MSWKATFLQHIFIIGFDEVHRFDQMAIRPASRGLIDSGCRRCQPSSSGCDVNNEQL